MLSGVKLKNGITKYDVDPRNVEHTEVGEEMLSFLNQFNKIEEKSKCLRVQFLDWLSDKLLDWSNRVHEISFRIDSPCVIKVEPRSKEESKSAKESKEIARLKELLDQSKRDQAELLGRQATYEETVALAEKLLKEEK